jgi:DNA-binding winged helix-turn-helix (wHTH) protein
MGVKTGVIWTPEEDEILRTMAASKKSAFLISARLKRSVKSIRRRGYELAIPIETPAATRRKIRAVSGSENESRDRVFH